VNDAPEQQITVPGGIRFSVSDPLLWVKLLAAGSISNVIGDGQLKIEGTPAWANGRTGQAIQFNDAGSAIEAADLDLYRKSFTLSAWVNIGTLANGGDLALFGGRAPMGADQDSTGTELSAGIHGGKMYMSFHGRQVEGRRNVPIGSWVNLTYTYDSELQQSALYLNGAPDRMGTMAPYAGPLQTIGDAPELGQGSYSLDEAVVSRAAFTRDMVRRLSDKGIDSFREGEFVSSWRAASGSYNSLQAAAEIPDGSAIAVIVEIGDKTGRVLHSNQIELRPGKEGYALNGLDRPSANDGEQVRIRVDLSNRQWGKTPFLRTVTISGDSDSQGWATPRNWVDGQLEPSLANDAGAQTP
jgi:hypothetical protein